MFCVRLLSGVVLLAFVALTNYFGGNVILAYALVLALLGLYEFNKAGKLQKSALAIASYIATVGFFAAIKFLPVLSFLPLVILIILAAAIYVIRYPEYKVMELTHVVFGFVYVAILMSYLYKTRMLDGGIYYVWLIYFSSWGSDTFAYLAGITIGRIGNHKLCPKLSPKKTVEGFVGGMVGATVLGIIYGIVVGTQAWVSALVCLLGSIVSVVGDLVASAFKRHYEIKDYSRLIPGHGGVLDRYDSVLFTAPFVYFALEIVNLII